MIPVNVCSQKSISGKLLVAWSRDGELLAFTSISEDEVITTQTVRRDGSQLIEVVDGYGGHLQWSQDGTELLASRVHYYPSHTGPKGNLEYQGIYAVRLEGSGIRPVLPHYSTTDNVTDATGTGALIVGLTAWSSDGSRIAFYDALFPDSPGTIITTKFDGTDLRILALPSRVGLDGDLLPWTPPSSAEQMDTAICSSGVVVPDPNEQPELIDDCEALIAILGELAGGGDTTWFQEVPFSQWDGIGLGGSPPRVQTILIDLHYQSGLKGTISDRINTLTDLHR